VAWGHHAVELCHAPNPRYFGHRFGATYLNEVSDHLTGIFAIVVPGTIRDREVYGRSQTALLRRWLGEPRWRSGPEILDRNSSSPRYRRYCSPKALTTSVATSTVSDASRSSTPRYRIALFATARTHLTPG
jgi:hypothetical protein